MTIIVDFNSLIPVLSGAAGGLASSGVLKGPINSLNDWWYVNFGYKEDLARQKRELLNVQEISKYKNDILKEVSKIPGNQVKTPQVNIIGPALEASVYYIGTPEIRNMFARLVASSLDKREVGKTRSAFVEFIKQMDPLDAVVLRFVSNKARTPVARLDRVLDSSMFSVEYSGLLSLEINVSISNRKLIPASLDNLKRLSLIDIDYNAAANFVNYPEAFSKTPEYKKCFQLNQQENQKYQKTWDIVQHDPSALGYKEEDKIKLKTMLSGKVKITAGSITLPSLGREFARICL